MKRSKCESEIDGENEEKGGRKVTEDDEIMRIEVPTGGEEGFEEYKIDRRIVSEEEEIGENESKEMFGERIAIVEEIVEDQAEDNLASAGGRSVQLVSETAEEVDKLPVHQRLGQGGCWSAQDLPSFQNFEEMKQVMVKELYQDQTDTH